MLWFLRGSGMLNRWMLTYSEPFDVGKRSSQPVSQRLSTNLTTATKSTILPARLEFHLHTFEHTQRSLRRTHSPFFRSAARRTPLRAVMFSVGNSRNRLDPNRISDPLEPLLRGWKWGYGISVQPAPNQAPMRLATRIISLSSRNCSERSAMSTAAR